MTREWRRKQQGLKRQIVKAGSCGEVRAVRTLIPVRETGVRST